MELLTGHILYLLGLTALALSVPEVAWDPQARQFLFVIGAVALWRYSWAAFNWLRYLVFRHIVFPRWRKAADALGESAQPSHAYLLVTSFRIGTETTRRVYHSVIAEAVRYNRPVTVVASIVERADQLLIQEIFRQHRPSALVKLIFVRIAGTGKRDALAVGLRAISRRNPPADSVVAVIDGDSMLPPRLIEKCAPMFALMPDVAALTTDEHCEVEGNWLFREWYNMRFAQRNIYMGSCSLSKRVLTLTGRMSMFRAAIVTDPDFIRRIEHDWINHWRLGRFTFLTGDDKSSWFHILKAGHAMLYIPDVQVITIETPPTPRFIESSLMLMCRWFGNMLRTNDRAIALGPGPMGLFPWLAILDQRIAMWTSLASPVTALLAALCVSPLALVYYLLWMGITRYILALSLLVSRPRVSAFYPFLLYYNQVVGALVKTFVLFRPDKQKWTRQQTILQRGHSPAQEWRLRFGSAAMHGLAMAGFVLLLATATEIMPIPDMHFWYNLPHYN